MFTSDTNKYSKIALVYVLICVFCAVFGAIYEVFSFGVYSYFMLYAFAFPLVGGALPALIFSLLDTAKKPGALVRGIYHCGIATLTVGSIIRGVLDIYGTTNALTQWYWLAGTALVALAFVVHLIQLIIASLRKNPSVDQTTPT